MTRHSVWASGYSSVRNDAPNCGPGSKACGKRCIPQDQNCRSSGAGRALKVGAAVAGAAALGLGARAAYKNRAKLQGMANQRFRPGMERAVGRARGAGMQARSGIRSAVGAANQRLRPGAERAIGRARGVGMRAGNAVRGAASAANQRFRPGVERAIGRTRGAGRSARFAVGRAAGRAANAAAVGVNRVTFAPAYGAARRLRRN